MTSLMYRLKRITSRHLDNENIQTEIGKLFNKLACEKPEYPMHTLAITEDIKERENSIKNVLSQISSLVSERAVLMCAAGSLINSEDEWKYGYKSLLKIDKHDAEKTIEQNLEQFTEIYLQSIHPIVDNIYTTYQKKLSNIEPEMEPYLERDTKAALQFLINPLKNMEVESEIYKGDLEKVFGSQLKHEITLVDLLEQVDLFRKISPAVQNTLMEAGIDIYKGDLVTKLAESRVELAKLLAHQLLDQVSCLSQQISPAVQNTHNVLTAYQLYGGTGMLPDVFASLEKSSANSYVINLLPPPITDTETNVQETSIKKDPGIKRAPRTTDLER
jgi:uncharacterized protein YqgQ